MIFNVAKTGFDQTYKTKIETKFIRKTKRN